MAEQPSLTTIDRAARAPARRFIRLDPRDNVIVAVVSLPTGTIIEPEGVTVARAVPMGHKVATRAIPAGSTFSAKASATTIRTS